MKMAAARGGLLPILLQRTVEPVETTPFVVPAYSVISTSLMTARTILNDRGAKTSKTDDLKKNRYTRK